MYEVFHCHRCLILTVQKLDCTSLLCLCARSENPSAERSGMHFAANTGGGNLQVRRSGGLIKHNNFVETFKHSRKRSLFPSDSAMSPQEGETLAPRNPLPRSFQECTSQRRLEEVTYR